MHVQECKLLRVCQGGRACCVHVTHTFVHHKRVHYARAGVQAAARMSGGAAPRATKLLPPSIDMFGWCTWDAFYSTVSAKGIQVCMCVCVRVYV